MLALGVLVCCLATLGGNVANGLQIPLSVPIPVLRTDKSNSAREYEGQKLVRISRPSAHCERESLDALLTEDLGLDVWTATNRYIDVRLPFRFPPHFPFGHI
jgi:hypothetical protein